jgi:hypothetical protein
MSGEFFCCSIVQKRNGFCGNRDLDDGRGYLSPPRLSVEMSPPPLVRRMAVWPDKYREKAFAPIYMGTNTGDEYLVAKQ